MTNQPASPEISSQKADSPTAESVQPPLDDGADGRLPEAPTSLHVAEVEVVDAGKSLASLTLSTASISPTNSETRAWTLTILNQSGLPQAFILVPSVPLFEPLLSPESVRVSVYQTSLRVAAETGSHTFVIPEYCPGAQPVYAIAGCARREPAAGNLLFVSDYALLHGDGVDFADRCIMTMPEGWEASFVKQTPKKPGHSAAHTATAAGAERKGRLSVEVDTSFPIPNPAYPFVGIGAKSPNSFLDIVPLVTWDAIPGTIYTFQPRLDIWTVARASSTKGAIIEMSELSQSPSIRFTGVHRRVEVVYDRNGVFGIVNAH